MYSTIINLQNLKGVLQVVLCTVGAQMASSAMAPRVYHNHLYSTIITTTIITIIINHPPHPYHHYHHHHHHHH